MLSILETSKALNPDYHLAESPSMCGSAESSPASHIPCDHDWLVIAAGTPWLGALRIMASCIMPSCLMKSRYFLYDAV